jgi:hypothetical protein
MLRHGKVVQSTSKYLQEVNLAWKRKSEGRKKDLAEGLGLSLVWLLTTFFSKANLLIV